MNHSLLSKRYNVRKMNTNDVPLILSLCTNNEQYYRFYPPIATVESINHDLTVLPPNKTMDDKYYLGFFEDKSLVAVMDLIMDCPSKGIAFIGFFMLDKSRQNKGIGTLIIDELCSSLKQMGINSIRLAWVKDNPVPNHFWKKNGFKPIKDTEQDGISLVLAQKDL